MEGPRDAYDYETMAYETANADTVTMRDPKIEEGAVVDARKEIDKTADLMYSGFYFKGGEIHKHIEITAADRKATGFLRGFMGGPDGPSTYKNRILQFIGKKASKQELKSKIVINVPESDMTDAQKMAKLEAEQPELAAQILENAVLIKKYDVNIYDLALSLTYDNIKSAFPQTTTDAHGNVIVSGELNYNNLLVDESIGKNLQEQVWKDILGLKVMKAFFHLRDIQKHHNQYLDSTKEGGRYSGFKDLLFLTVRLYQHMPSVAIKQFTDVLDMNRLMAQSCPTMNEGDRNDVGTALSSAIDEWFASKFPQIYEDTLKGINTDPDNIIKGFDGHSTSLIYNEFVGDTTLFDADSLRAVFVTMLTSFIDQGKLSLAQYTRMMRLLATPSTKSDSKVFDGIFKPIPIFEQFFDSINSINKIVEKPLRNEIDDLYNIKKPNQWVLLSNALGSMLDLPSDLFYANMLLGDHLPRNPWRLSNHDRMHLSTFAALLHLRSQIHSVYQQFIPSDLATDNLFTDVIMPDLIQSEILPTLSRDLVWKEYFQSPINVLFEDDIYYREFSKVSQKLITDVNGIGNIRFQIKYNTIIDGKTVEIITETTATAEEVATHLFFNPATENREISTGIEVLLVGEQGFPTIRKGDPLYNALLGQLTTTAAGAHHMGRPELEGEKKDTAVDQIRILQWKIDGDPDSQSKFLVQIYEILDLRWKGYAAKHNHEFFEKQALGLPQIAVATDTRFQFYQAEIMAMLPNNRRLTRFGSLITMTEMQLYTQLMNPKLMSRDQYKANYLGLSDLTYDQYAIAIENYANWVKENYHDANTFQESLQFILEEYLKCFPDNINNAYELASRQKIRETVRSLQANLGINPAPGRSHDRVWERTITYYHPDDLLPTEYHVYIGDKMVAWTFYVPRPGAVAITRTVTIDRRVQMVVANPEIDTSDWGLDVLQTAVIERLKVQTIYMQNKLLMGYDKILHVFGDSSHTYFPPCWSYQSNYFGSQYIGQQFLTENSLPSSFFVVSAQHIHDAFPAPTIDFASGS